MHQLDLFPSCKPVITVPRKLEAQLRKEGYFRVVGVDEAGRGPLAGPVVACACYLPPRARIPGLTDSKLLSEKQIKELYQKIVSYPGVEHAIALIGPDIVDRLNILQATFQAMQEAVSKLEKAPDIAIVDGRLDPFLPCKSIQVVKADLYCRSVSAASIIAKYSRDQIMLKLDALWPEYGFAYHKGYATVEHLRAIKKHGPSPVHRMSFAPLKANSEQSFLF